MYINRTAEKTIKTMISMFKVILITGPREMGKATLLKHILMDDYHYITLDDINELDIARSDPKLFFLNNPGKLIIDEVQNAPELFREIKRIVDAQDINGQIILTGSQTFPLMHNITETLAGRIGIFELNGLSSNEIKGNALINEFIPTETYLNQNKQYINSNQLWELIHRGSFPYLHQNKEADLQLYYSSYVKSYIERDVRALINIKDLSLFSRFMIALAARTSQLLNYTSLANDLGIDAKTIKNWISILEASGIIVLIQPFSNNHLSRAIKTPTMYFMDTGLVCYLLKWPNASTLMNGAMSGQLLETFVISEIIKSFKNKGIINVPIYFYRDKDMKEIDVIIEDSGVLYPIEIKKNATPKKSMAKHLSILEKAVGYTIGPKLILCLIDKKMYLSDDIIAYPIGLL